MSVPDLPSFRPLPFLSNPHVQTVVGRFFGWTRDHLSSVLHLVPLPDGDKLALHEKTPDSWQPGQGCALLVHGLGGSHRSVYVRRIANRLTGNGMRVYSIDLRGVGAGAIHAKSFYNATCSADIRSALEWMAEQNPGSPLVLAGFSMGGGIALKMSGEAADRPINGLVGVAALGAPLDLVRCAELISQYPFYDRFYVKHLIAQVHARSRHFPELEIPPFPRGTTLRRFDEIYTVPQGGFASIEEYLRQASALQWVSRIRMPTFLLTSRDDPFIDVGSYDELPPSPFCETIVAPSGGHLGFLGHDGNGGFRWAEARVAQWILSQGFVPNQFRIAQ